MFTVISRACGVARDVEINRWCRSLGREQRYCVEDGVSRLYKQEALLRPFSTTDRHCEKVWCHIYNKHRLKDTETNDIELLTGKTGLEPPLQREPCVFESKAVLAL